jgi:2-(1,2-epoxy-1,2-dihydrophenyl)acetyl-CoA isomerase
MTQGELVELVVAGGVARIRLNRPEALNALTAPMKQRLLAALQAVHADDGVRAVLLGAAGRGFCAGQDLREHAANLEGSTSGQAGEALDTVRQHYNPIITAITTMPKPVVVAVNGMAAGAGAAIAFAADFRLVADNASFLMAFARVGLGADSGASWTLQRLIGLGRATAMLMLAEPVSAQQALEMGLVNAVVPAAGLEAAAAELAAKLAAGPTFAYGAIKQALRAGASTDLASALELEATLQAQCGATRDHAAAVQAFVAKQTAVFTGA